MIKKLKSYIQSRKDKIAQKWAEMDFEKEEKIEKIKKSRSDRSLKDAKTFLFHMVGTLVLLCLVPIVYILMARAVILEKDALDVVNTEEINISTVAYEDVVNDSNAIVNFNQLFNNNNLRETPYYNIDLSKVDIGTYHVEGTNTNWTAYIAFDSTTANINIISGHKYFIRANCTQDNVSCGLFKYDTQTSVYLVQNYTSEIFTAGANVSCGFGFYINVGFNYNFNAQPCLIDLTQMFGSGNEPTLEQAQELFVADYYAYNTGSAVSLSGLNSYADGFNQASALTEYMPTASSFITSIQDVDLPNSNLFGVISRGSSGITITTTSTTKDLAGYYPFNLVVPIGTKVSISARAGHNNGNFSTPIKFAYLDSVGNVNVITSANITSNSGFGLSFISPINLSGLYIIVPSDESTSYSVQIWDIKISMLVTNAIAGIQSAYDSGYEKGVEFASRSYGVGGNGYNQIFEAGRLQGIDDAGNYTFLSLLTTAIDVPINSVLHMLDFDLLGMNMKSFYLSMFTFAIIVFVIKLLI